MAFGCSRKSTSMQRGEGSNALNWLAAKNEIACLLLHVVRDTKRLFSAKYLFEEADVP